MSDASWTPHIVFILGAGASVHTGAPTMANFYAKAEDLFRGRGNYVKDPIFDLVHRLKGINSYSSVDLTNIEVILGILEMGSVFGRIGEIGVEEIATLKTSFKKLIASTLERSMIFPTEEVGTGHGVTPSALYWQLAKKIKILIDRGTSVSIISFNYDVGIDLALHYENIDFRYHIEPREPDSQVALLKLHGSLNWFKANDTNIPLKVFHLRDNLGTQSVELFGDVPKNAFISFQRMAMNWSYSRDDQRLNEFPVIIPPTWSKTDYSGQIENVWTQASRVLGLATTIGVVGYSFPASDSFFRYLYSLGCFGRNTLRSFHVFDVDPIGGDVEHRYRELLGPSLQKRFSYHEGGFHDLIYNTREFGEP